LSFHPSIQSICALILAQTINRSAKASKEIAVSTEKTNTGVRTVSDAAQHAAQGANEVAKIMDMIHKAGQEVEEDANEVAKQFSELQQEVTDLRAMIKDFRLLGEHSDALHANNAANVTPPMASVQ
jgi:methyl-accepting chemotaxis protein